MAKELNNLYAKFRQKRSSCKAWRKSCVEQSLDWTLMLSEPEIEALSNENVELQNPVLSKLGDELYLRLTGGFCFVLLKGLNSGHFSVSEHEIILRRLGSILGTLTPQSIDGSFIGHQADRGVGWRETQPFHSDGGDIVGLLCVRKALHGGFTMLASSLAVYEEIRRIAPSLLDVLYREFHFHRHGRPGPPTFIKSIFSEDEDGINCFYLPGTLRSTPLRVGIPLNEEQLRAIDLFDKIVNRADINYQLLLSVGDILLVNNRKVLHARTAYEDSANKAEQRLLLRIWIILKQSPR